jgi:hypothetical protein
MAEVQSTAALDRFLNGEDGPVFRWLAAGATRVETQAKLNATGIPVAGASNPEMRGPRVQTGLLRSSITQAFGRDELGPFVDVGTPVYYGAYLENGWTTSTGRFIRYPFLEPALVAF